MERWRIASNATSARTKKILALIPRDGRRSDGSGSSSDEEKDLCEIQSDVSSDAPSLEPGLRLMNLLSSSSEEENIHSAPEHVSPSILVQSEGPLRKSPLIIPPSPTSISPSPPPSALSLFEDIPSLPIPSNLTIGSLEPFTSPQVPSVPESISLPQTPSTSGITTNVILRRSSKRKNNHKKTSANQPPAKKPKVTKALPIVYKWKRTRFLHRAEISEEEFKNEILPNKTALQYFYDFFSEDIIESIVHNTNLYSVQEKGRSINVTIDELRDFLAIELMMGIVKAPSYLDYWAARTRCPFIADIMPLKKYETIRRYIHFADNTNTSNSLDPFFKIRPFIESIRQNCLKVEEENKFSIDEMVIPYKGRKAGKKKQYNPQKPRKWGFKNIVRAGASGIVYDFFLYCGDDSFKYFDVEFDDDEVDMGWGGKAVLALCKSIQKKACVVYFDNFFSSLPLVQLLRQKYGIFSLGTIRANRLKGCQELLPDDKSLMKKGRGASSQLVDNENQLAIVKWYDNKCVTLVSSYVDSHPLQKIMRYDKKVKARVQVDFPQIVKHYNAHMGGVDLADMLIALYRTEMKTRRWYLSIFSQMIDLCVNNAWLTYRRDLKKSGTIPKKLKHFRMDISEDLRKFGRLSLPASVPQLSDSKKIAYPKRNRPCADVRFDNIGHNQVGTTYGRCRFCKKGQTNVFCTKCNMRLCFIPNKRNCFYNYHNTQ